MCVCVCVCVCVCALRRCLPTHSTTKHGWSTNTFHNKCDGTHDFFYLQRRGKNKRVRTACRHRTATEAPSPHAVLCLDVGVVSARRQHTRTTPHVARVCTAEFARVPFHLGLCFSDVLCVPTNVNVNATGRFLAGGLEPKNLDSDGTTAAVATFRPATAGYVVLLCAHACGASGQAADSDRQWWRSIASAPAHPLPRSSEPLSFSVVLTLAHAHTHTHARTHMLSPHLRLRLCRCRCQCLVASLDGLKSSTNSVDTHVLCCLHFVVEGPRLDVPCQP